MSVNWLLGNERNQSKIKKHPQGCFRLFGAKVEIICDVIVILQQQG